MADFTSGLQWAETAVLVGSVSLTNSSPILRRDKTSNNALLFIVTSQPNDTYKLQ